jgi:pyruvate kinase
VIACVTGSGGVARLISEYRPEAKIVALTDNEVTYRRLGLVWGVTPVMLGSAVTTEELIDRVEHALADRGLARSGEHVVITTAVPVGSGQSTNLLKIHLMS